MLTVEDREVIREIVAETAASVLALAVKEVLAGLEKIRQERTGKIGTAQDN